MRVRCEGERERGGREGGTREGGCHRSFCDHCPMGQPRVERPSKARMKNISRKER